MSKRKKEFVCDFKNRVCEEFISSITWDKLNTKLSDILGVKTNLIIVSVLYDTDSVLISLGDITNYADQCGILKNIFNEIQLSTSYAELNVVCGHLYLCGNVHLKCSEYCSIDILEFSFENGVWEFTESRKED